MGGRWRWGRRERECGREEGERKCKEAKVE